MMEMRLIHDGEYWMADNDTLSARARTLEQLDREIESILKKNFPPEEKGRVQIRMTFDNSTIPQWIRQYSQHYFNRVVTIDLGENRS